ncbi:MAG: SDR family oxidoreductase [Deltaproteobacteria bacterium]|nr:SDR family oxidoreductase [Deltaproteobacteria bacterium]MDQ3297385.1 SDR family oxidoreductase [Myxococcota bacterium]
MQHKQQRQDGPMQEPKPPFPEQKLDKPGLEADLKPRPKYEAPRYKAAGKLVGKCALITGGDSGIGRAVAVLFAREGADVVINYLAAEQRDAQETKRAVEAEGRRCVLAPGDLGDAKVCVELVERTVKELGGIDILVSNAAHQNRKQLEELEPEEFDRTFKVNVYAYYHLAKAAVPHMKPGSAIIASSSSTGFRGNEELPDYSASKGAINQFTKVLAQQLVSKGIRVNAVAPGPVWTPLNAADEGMTPEKVAEFGAKTPLERPGQPEEIAPAYVFLASEADSSFITGIILPVLGGETIGA